VDWLRRRQPIGQFLAPWLRSGEALTCGMVRMEVLRGIRVLPTKAWTSDLFDVMLEVPLTSALLHEAAEMAWLLDRKGIALPITDLVIAQCALTSSATLITLDDHFRLIPGLKHQKNLPAFR
jgi:predicted nucleic acid-binding protein